MPRRGREKGPGRCPVMAWGLCLLLAVVAGRLVWLQAVAGPAYAAMAERQRSCDLTLSPRRGTIRDREGEPLAANVPATTIYAVPTDVVDPEGVARALAAELGGAPSDYLAKLRKKTNFVYIARKVDAGAAMPLRDMELAGVGFIEDSKRVYPSGSLACQVLGFVGVDDSGLAGIEKQYDEVIAGTPGRLVAERDPFGRIIPGGVSISVDPVDGRDITLTIDRDIQYAAQMELLSAVKRWGAKGGSVVVMDPRDGSILAMASTPVFDPNRYGEADPKAMRNRGAQDAFEPGSTIKSLTAAAVIDAGLFGPQSAFTLPPTLRVADRVIHESHPRGTVRWTLAQIVTNSSNIGAVKLGLALGPKRLYRYFERFGLTQRTGVDFPGESKGRLPAPSDWSASSIGNIPFGQGLSLTPLQLTRAMAAIANGGRLVTPHFLMSMGSGEGDQSTWKSRNVMSARTALTTTEVLKHVVVEGTGKAAAVAGYEVAGKTGTAQKARDDGKGYAKGRYVASFTGYLPAGDPRVLVTVFIDQPSRAIYGGAVAAPSFSRIAAFAVSHLKVPPTTPGGASRAGVGTLTAPAGAGVSSGVRGSMSGSTSHDE